ncbi:lysophospholipid acyltransferase family protein [Cognatishimia sp. F0-27]|uniref:lysophospholipid acyltransferase family protein n=1 Tax=Cognatishimia sp. F0-27 TaxID=2816855 RepID=UPI001D0CCC79|nr:lysophospholipid acyltransferase family protein [Cognatishimia sp. F0-27]MCC1493368.1 lysophospholipid acyltransferase family protein [Cognatishimia sp. F0-27]
MLELSRRSSRLLARKITYAGSAQTRGGRAVVRLMENATGRIRLIRRAEGYEREVAEGRDFWDVMVARYGLEIRVFGERLAAIPRTGPLVLIANHPYGILDGLVMGQVLSQTRGDFRIVANSVFGQAPAMDGIVLPICFDGGRESVARNLATRKAALDYLARGGQDGQGGAIGIFPGGTVSTAARPFARPMDPGWRAFTAKMIARSGATVVPLYFAGHTSRLFQVASHLHSTLRLGLLIREFDKRVDTPVEITVGAPVDPGEIAAHAKEPNKLMDFLRHKTYELGPDHPERFDYGLEFEDRYRRGNAPVRRY